MTENTVNVILSLDVEEEGLFGGAYLREVSVRNVASLERLLPLQEEFSLPVTLLCTYSVFNDLNACRVLDRLRQRSGAGVEIGAHLHHWNTPPLDTAALGGGYVSPGSLPRELFAARLGNLMAAGRQYSGEAMTSFRMGKWDLHHWHWPYLVEAGIKVDGSVRPLHHGPAGRPDHFSAPADPYVVRVGQERIIEVPLTVTPLYLAWPNHLNAMEKILPTRAGEALKTSVQKWSALAVLPIYHPLWAMKLITSLYLARGGKFLALTWHSSEMMPGGAPHMPNEAAVQAFMNKMRAFLGWLNSGCVVKGMTLGQMASLPFSEQADYGAAKTVGEGGNCADSGHSAGFDVLSGVVDKRCDWKYD